MNLELLHQYAHIPPRSFRIHAVSDRLGHIPFASWCAATLNPSVYVGLGVGNGDSYFSLCETIRQKSLSTHAYGIDPWKSGAGPGPSTESPYRDVSNYNRKSYSTFSSVIRSNFHEALGHFESGTIDLLQISGPCTYEGAIDTFESWLPKLSERSIVLLEGIAVRRNGWEMWRVWEQVAKKYAAFEFGHNGGLGVLVCGENAPTVFQKLCALEGLERTNVQLHFETLGSRLVIAAMQDEQVRAQAELNAPLSRLNRFIQDVQRKTRVSYYKEGRWRALLKAVHYVDRRIARLPIPTRYFFPFTKGEQVLPSAAPQSAGVLVVSTEASRTGAPVLALNIVSELAKKHPVATILLDGGALISEFRKQSAILVGPLESKGPRPDRLREIVRQITAKFPIEYAIVNSIESVGTLQPLFDSTIPTILLIHEFSANTFPVTKYEEAARWASRIVISSPLVCEDVRKVGPEIRSREILILPQGQCQVPGPPVEARLDESGRIAAILRPPQVSPKPVVVLGCGTMEFRKGVDLFFAAAAGLIEADPGLGIRFVWIGREARTASVERYSDQLLDQINRAGIEEHAFMMGEVADLDFAYSLTDVLFISSRLDPLPNVAIDAMCRGIPVVCFERATGIAGILGQDPVTADCVVPYIDVAEAAKRIGRLVRDQAYRADVSRAVRDLAKRNFDMESYVARLDEIGREARGSFSKPTGL
jgi:glycosyltransferase involved in cell wall biosynthesis